MTQWTRLQELESFKLRLQELESFLDMEGPDEPIQIIDPEQQLYEFGISVEKAIVWVKKEMELADEKENELLPSEGRRTGAMVGE